MSHLRASETLEGRFKDSGPIISSFILCQKKISMFWFCLFFFKSRQELVSADKSLKP